MEYHLQAIDELSIPDDSDVDNVDHLDASLPVISKLQDSTLSHQTDHCFVVS